MPLLTTLLLLIGVITCAGNAVFRYVFSMGAPWAQELPMVFCGIAILIAMVLGYSRRDDRHIRVDLLTHKASPHTKNIIEKIGILTCLLPWMALILWGSFENQSSFIRLAWRTHETSDQVGGLQFIYVYKSLLGVFALALFIQGVRRLISNLPSPIMGEGAPIGAGEGKK